MTITPVLNGFIVEVGCQKIVFTNLTILGQELVRYYAAPERVEREYVECAINKQLLKVPPGRIERVNRPASVEEDKRPNVGGYVTMAR